MLGSIPFATRNAVSAPIGQSLANFCQFDRFAFVVVVRCECVLEMIAAQRWRRTAAAISSSRLSRSQRWV